LDRVDCGEEPTMTLIPAPINRPRGGYRPGAGRKPSELTERFRDYFAGDLDALLAALQDLALGHQREDAQGRVYTVAPDRGALTYVLDRLLGKPRAEGEAPDVEQLLVELRGHDRQP
jgi:hypothetical protein